MNGTKVVAITVVLSVVTGCTPNTILHIKSNANNITTSTSSMTNASLKKGSKKPTNKANRLHKLQSDLQSNGILTKSHTKKSNSVNTSNVKGISDSKPKSTPSKNTHSSSTVFNISSKDNQTTVLQQSYQQQLAEDAKAQAQAMAKVEYQDTHNPNLDGQDSTQNAGLKYEGTGKGTTIGPITSQTIPLKPGDTFTINTNPNSPDYGNYSISTGGH